MEGRDRGDRAAIGGRASPIPRSFLTASSDQSGARRGSAEKRPEGSSTSRKGGLSCVVNSAFLLALFFIFARWVGSARWPTCPSPLARCGPGLQFGPPSCCRHPLTGAPYLRFGPRAKSKFGVICPVGGGGGQAEAAERVTHTGQPRHPAATSGSCNTYRSPSLVSKRRWWRSIQRT